MSSGSERREDPGHRPSGAAPSTPNVRLSSDNVLESVLAQSAGKSEGAGKLTPEQLEAARSVARRYRGRPFDLDPVLVELIHALLAVRFSQTGMPAKTIRAMARAAAEELFKDDETRARSEALWQRLAESL